MTICRAIKDRKVIAVFQVLSACLDHQVSRAHLAHLENKEGQAYR